MKPALPLIYALLGVGVLIVVGMGLWNKRPIDGDDIYRM